MRQKIFILFLVSLLNGHHDLQAQESNTIPSCVITYPHNNAYYQEGTDLEIRVYSTGFGGTNDPAGIVKIEFFADSVMIHETSEHYHSTYSFLWEDLQAGTYRITATATDDLGTAFTSAGVIVTVGIEPVIRKGMSAGKGKYLGNIVGHHGIRSDFNDFWNGVTAENGAKWGVVEGTRNVMNWTQADYAYNHAYHHNMMYRYHAIAWGSQYPQWITELEPEEFRQEFEEYMAAVAERYPLIDQVDVLNEQLRTHASGTGYFRDALGGTGETGYDWQIWIFEKARHYFPDSKLVLNDYGLENDATAINEMLGLVRVLRDRGLIDGFGTQAHYFNVDQMASQPNTMKTRIDLMASGGIPVYVTELDLRGSSNNESSQLFSYQKTFPVFWEHPAVAGITLWGYVEGQTWQDGTGLINSDDSKRSAMLWLEEYLAGQPDTGYPHYGIEPEPDSNMIYNGEFNYGTTGWDIQLHNNAHATMEVVTGEEMSGPNALRICPVEPGTANWHIQVRQNAPFEAGREYRISFMAKADTDRVMDVSVQREGSPWTTHHQRSFDLTAEVQEFSHVFAPSVTDATAKLKFYAGNDQSCVYIDRVEFVDITEPEPDPDPEPEPEAPDFAPVGANWYYTEFNPMSSGDISYKKISSTGDTIVNGRECRILEKEKNLIYTERPDIEYMYQEDSVVWFWDETFEKFQVLYDLTKSEGEYWIIEVLDINNNNKLDTLRVTVDSVSVIEINDQLLKELHVTYLMVSVEYSQPYSSTIIEKIGDIKYMFNYIPSSTVAYDGPISGGLRCYEDPELGLYSTGIAESCDYEYTDPDTGSTLYEQAGEVQVFPNPTRDVINIITGTAIKLHFELLDTRGVILKEGNLPGDVRLDISDMPVGIYLLRILDNNRLKSNHKILKY